MKLEMFKGRESSLIIEDAIRSIKEDGFLADSYSKAFQALCDYITRSDRIRAELFREEYPSTRNGILYRSPQNIIAFSGKRGSGKSSTMLSFSDVLGDLNNLNELCDPSGSGGTNEVYSELKGKRFVVLDPIDPTALEKNQSILSVVLSRMLFKAEENWTNHISFYGSFQDKESQKTELLSSARQCLNGISTIKSKKEVPQELSDLQKVGDSSILKKNLFDFVELFLQFSDAERNTTSKNSILVLQIDDTDCQIIQGYEVMEDIRKYLTIPNVLILMATDTNQLRQVLIQHYVSDFSSNLKEGLVKKEELRHLGEKHLTKLMPPPCVIHLPTIDDTILDKSGLLQLYYYEKEGQKRNLLDPGEEKNYTEYDFQSVLLRFIYKKTHIVFTSHDAYSNNIIPTTLRGLAYLLSQLSSMEDVPEIDLSTGSLSSTDLVQALKKQFPILERNLNLFEEYFLHDWIQAKLPQDKIEIIEKFSNQAPDQRIPFIVKELAAYYDSRRPDHTADMFLSFWNLVAPTYVDLDELLRIIQGTKNADKEVAFRQAEDFYFVFAVRTALSIKNNRDILRVKRRTVRNFALKQSEKIIFNYLKGKTSLPAGFYLEKTNLYGHDLVCDRTVGDQIYTNQTPFRSEAHKRLFNTFYFPSNDRQYFNFTGGVIQWLAPKDLGEMDQLEIYKAQELAALMAANCDVQETARKAVAREQAKTRKPKADLKEAVEAGLALIQGAVSNINQEMFKQYALGEGQTSVWKVNDQTASDLVSWENPEPQEQPSSTYPKFDGDLPNVDNEDRKKDFKQALTQYSEQLEKYALNMGKEWDKSKFETLNELMAFEPQFDPTGLTNEQQFTELMEKLYKELDKFFQDDTGDKD